MVERERKILAEAAIPLEVLCAQIRTKPYKEMTDEFQSQLLNSLELIRSLVFGERWIGDVPTHCDVCKCDVPNIFIDGMVATAPTQPWGIMCESCHVEHGKGLGEGKGQKYQKQGDQYIKVA